MKHYEHVLTPKLRSNGLPLSEVYFRYTAYQDFAIVDTSYFADNELAKVQQMIRSGEIAVDLKTLRSNKRFLTQSINEGLNIALSLQDAIEEYYKEVKLLSDKIGIVGNALETGWLETVPMTVKDSRNMIWELEIELGEGFVKFRNANDWNLNWGGRSFPTGSPIFYGENIPVRAGRYLVRLDLERRNYEFIKIDQ